MTSDDGAEVFGDDPRYEFGDAIKRLVGNACEQVAQIRLGVDAVELWAVSMSEYRLAAALAAATVS